MKIFVTGGSGFLGSNFIKNALSRGYQICNFDALTYAASLGNLDDVKYHPNYLFLKGDVRDKDFVEGAIFMHQPISIVHFAAESHVDNSIECPTIVYDTNVIGTLNLLEAARKYWDHISRDPNFRFHHISTDEVFGSLKTQEFFTENSAYAPNSPYAASKAASDHLVRSWNKTYNFPTSLSNCSNNFGPYQFPEKFIPKVIVRALHNMSIPIYGNGQNIRDWIFVDDHSSAIMMILEKGKAGSRYNIGGNNERTNIELAFAICELLDTERPDRAPHNKLIEYVGDRPGHDFRYAVDSTKIREELGWFAKTSFNCGLEKTVNWFVKNEERWLKFASEVKSND